MGYRLPQGVAGVLGALLCATLVLALRATAFAEADINVEGQSGILTTPTAEVIDEGDVAYQTAHFMSRALANRGDVLARSYSATIGYLPGVEATARFTDYPTVPDVDNGLANFQDRSAALKWQLLHNDDWSFAIGATDIGGESRKETTTYGVVSYHADGLTLSAGAGTDLLSGVFGSARLKLGDRVALLAENDTQDFNYGVELRPLKGVALKAGVVNSDTAWSGSYSFPLDSRGQDTPCCPVTVPRYDMKYATPCDEAAAVRDALVFQSFENVLVGSDGHTLFVEFENRRFREELDALAVAATVAASHAGPGIERLVITPKVEDVPQLTLQVPLDDLVSFLQTPEECGGRFVVTDYTAGCCSPETQYAPEGNKKPGHGEVLLYPVQQVDVARNNEPTWRTVFGLGLQEEAYLARGITLRARQEWPAMNDITEKTDPVNRDAYLTYLDNWGKDLYVYGTTGYYGNGRTGFTSEAGWFGADRWKLGARYGYFHDALDAADRQDGYALADVSYSFPKLDWEVSAMSGYFLEGDKGLRVESRRYFGPTELTFFAYDTDLSAPHGGFRLFVPLPWYGQGRHDAWRAAPLPTFSYQYRTDAEPGGDVPLGTQDLSAARQRLRPEYVREHLDWLRRAAYLFLQGQ